jgi:UDP-N-acetylmuramoylalanine--D-glutamate ligase
VSGLFKGERVVVIGFGTSGRAAATVLLDEGAQVWVSEARSPAEVDADADPTVVPWPDVAVRAGGHRPEHLDGATLVVVSPGVPERAPILVWASRRGLPVWSELEVGARLCRVPFVAVTGTNGKTTTALLVAAAMTAGGLRAMACGNVGYPFSLAAREDHDALAVEASSFQLRFHRTFRPRVSVLLNLAPDHLDWHGTLEAYRGAKARVYELQGPGDVHVGNRDDPMAADVSRAAPCPVRWFTGSAPTGEGDVGVRDGRIVSADGADLGGSGTAGKAFRTDAAAAAAAALAFGVAPDAVRSAVALTRPPPHRGEVAASIDGVDFVDDSKATNPHAALASLEGRTDVVLIAGGLAKGVDLSPLAAAAGGLVAVVAIGEAASELERIFSGSVPTRRARSIEEAVATALALAPPGGTVLLAPACASQDMFRDYRERGDRFADAARALSGTRTSWRSHA